MFTLIWASVCGDGTPEEPIHEVVEIEARHLPTAGWDPILFRMETSLVQGEETLESFREEPVEPTVIDADGVEVPLIHASWHDYEYGYVADPPMAPGTYQVTWVGGHPLEEPETFEIWPNGQGLASFEAGAVYELTTLWAPGVGSAFGNTFEEQFWVEILEVTDDDVALRAVASYGGACDIFRGRAEVDDYGNLHWDHAGYTVNEDDTPFEVTELRLDLALSADGQSIAGAEATVVLDTRPIDDAMSDTGDSWDTCGFVNGFGIDCLPCSDGVSRCLALGTRASVLERVDLDLGELPSCGVDFSDVDVPKFDFDFGGCGCSTSSGRGTWLPLLLVLVGLGWRRRSSE